MIVIVKVSLLLLGQPDLFRSPTDLHQGFDGLLSLEGSRLLLVKRAVDDVLVDG